LQRSSLTTFQYQLVIFLDFVLFEFFCFWITDFVLIFVHRAMVYSSWVVLLTEAILWVNISLSISIRFRLTINF
jgi:hypothetical protein